MPRDTFPVPFAGITVGVQVGSELLDHVAAWLAGGCGHKHNFAVEGDTSPATVWTTAMGVECVNDLLLPGFKGMPTVGVGGE